VDHVHHAVVDRREPGRGVGHQASHRGIVDGSYDDAAARPATASRYVPWNRNQRARRRPFRGTGELLSHRGGDLLRLNSFRVAEQAVRGGEDRDAQDYRAGGDEERDVDARGEHQPARRVRREAAADEPDEAVGGRGHRPGNNDQVTDRWPAGWYVVVSGPPGSGKTTLATALAPALGLPLIAKDTIKEALMAVLPAPDVEASRLVGRASVAALLAVAAAAPGAVLESVWRHYARAGLAGLPGSVVEVFCRCDQAIAAQRYARRAGTRAAGHFDAERTIAELWNDEVARPVAGGWQVIEVDTTSPVDVGPLIARIRAVVNAASAGAS
jgi:predicted kinase